jgi:hypothetical protein
MPALPNAHALIVGIARYQRVAPLPVTVLADAGGVYDALVDPTVGGYAAGNVRLLLDEQATLAALRSALADLAVRCDADATVFLYFSCHGGRIEAGPSAGEYLLPIDAIYDSGESLGRTALSGAELTAALAAIPARKVVVVFDCCHAGGLGQPKDALATPFRAGLPEDYYDALKAGRGRAILASSRSAEYSWVLPGAPNSLFTAHLLAGLRGGIASDDGLIRLFDLFEYIQPRVTADQPNQHPIFKAEVEENFPIALYLGGTPGEIPVSADGYRYDAYILYAETSARDAAYVWEKLIPPLEAAGLRVAVSDDVLEGGVARVVGIERGMGLARRTVVVLSPAFLADAMAGFESVLALTMGIEQNIWRLLPVIIEPLDEARLPYIFSRNMAWPLDLVRPLRPQYGLPRVISTLREPPRAVVA